MKNWFPVAKQFSSPQKNQRKHMLFNIIVTLILVVVLAGVMAPYFLNISNFMQNAFTNFKMNISPHKIAALNPIAPNIRDVIAATADKSIFDPKDYKDIDDHTLEVTDRTGLIVLFGKETAINQQLSSLQSLLTKSRIESKRLKRVDLRFNKIAVEYETKSNSN